MPHLESEQQPQLVRGERVSRPETREQAADGPGVEQALSRNDAGLEVLVDELPPLGQPPVQGDAEALLGAIEIFARDVLVQDLAQQVLRAACAIASLCL